jgi:steroid 5-alpha-reductase/3-oxo-5-alpha-steroid 4-dehydrogenase 1
VTESELHATLVWALFVAAAGSAVVLIFISAPYGRHGRAGWGPQLANRTGWILMESPAVLLFGGVYLAGDHRAELAPLVLLALWQLHYVQRTFVFPFRLRTAGKRMPLVIVAIAVVFNSLNAYVNARWISHLGHYPDGWLVDPRLLGGAALFVTGWLINLHADTVLLRLRAPGETGYKIPRGGLYERISCPNYFGELLEWCGWALATWSLAGLAFAVFTAANLVPRAFTNHRWYRATFPDYPRQRRVLVPFVW